MPTRFESPNIVFNMHLYVYLNCFHIVIHHQKQKLIPLAKGSLLLVLSTLKKAVNVNKEQIWPSLPSPIFLARARVYTEVVHNSFLYSPIRQKINISFFVLLCSHSNICTL